MSESVVVQNMGHVFFIDTDLIVSVDEINTFFGISKTFGSISCRTQKAKTPPKRGFFRVEADR